MKRLGFKLVSFIIILMMIPFSFISCDKEEPTSSFTEEDYAGTYYGSHVISEKLLLDVIKGIDPTSDGSFLDTIEVSTGISTTDNLMEFKSKLLNGLTITADISKTNGGNVTALPIDYLVLSDSAQVAVKNALVKSSSSLKPSDGNTFNATLNISGTVEVAGVEIISLPNIPTKGVFKK